LRMVFLVTDTGSIKELQVPCSLSVGRGSSSDIKPESKSVSKRHGKLTIEKNEATGDIEAWIEDFGSTFGTFIGDYPANLEKIVEKTRVGFGFYIRFGHAPTCFQLLEFRPDKNSTTEMDDIRQTRNAPEIRNDAAVAATVPESQSSIKHTSKRESCRPPPLQNPTPLTQYNLTDEELAIQMQFGQTMEESPTSKSRTRELIDDFESKARSHSASPSNVKNFESFRSNSSMSSEKVPELFSAYGEEEGSFRDMPPQGSFMIGSKKHLNRPVESFSDILWDESHSVPTPTVCQPPGKTPSGKDGFQDEFDYESYAYDADEKAVSDRYETSQSSSPRGSAQPAAVPSRSYSNSARSPSPVSQSGGTFAAPPRNGGSIRPSSRGGGTPTEQTELQSLEQATLSVIRKRREVIANARQQFREQKLSQLQEASLQFPTYSSIARQWRKAVACVDSVAGGFCISVVLPYLDRVKVKPRGRSLDKVRIDARRWIDGNDKIATDEDSEYIAHFKLRGLTSEIQQEDLTYEYCEVTGLLCVYVNRLKLKNEQVMVKKKKWIPYFTSTAYAPRKVKNNNNNTSNNSQVIQKTEPSPSVFSWFGSGKKKKKEAETHTRTTKTYHKVLSRKKSMLEESSAGGRNSRGDRARALEHLDGCIDDDEVEI